MARIPANEGREAAIGAGNHLLLADDFGEPLQTLRVSSSGCSTLLVLVSITPNEDPSLPAP